MSAVQAERVAAQPPRRLAVGGLLAFLVIGIAGIYWAKWNPYFHKAFVVAASHRLGSSILSGSKPLPPDPSISAAVGYGLSYFAAIWTALVAGLLVAAAAEALVPRRWLVRAMTGRGRLGGILPGLLAVPCMMCTCCSAPVAVSLRRSGVPAAAALSWWVGNPAINPAVIVFAAFVLPWQWVVLRVLAGVLLVFVVVALVARLTGDGKIDAAEMEQALADPGPTSLRDALRRYVRALVRLVATLLPEYLVIVLLLGAFRGWLFPVAHGLGSWGPLGVVVCAVAGTLFVIPTAAEIPIVQAMLKAGVGAGPVAALLLTLPSTSLPSLAMAWRSFRPQVLLTLAGSVALVGILTAVAAVLWLGG